MVGTTGFELSSAVALTGERHPHFTIVRARRATAPRSPRARFPDGPPCFDAFNNNLDAFVSVAR